MTLHSSIVQLKSSMRKEHIEPEGGLGEELFLFASTLMPVINVDLLITNKDDNILLMWRDDPHSGTGWHVPGGCLRLRETLKERLFKTARNELGCEISRDVRLIKIFEIFSEIDRVFIKDQKERSHFVTFSYHCKSIDQDCIKKRLYQGDLEKTKYIKPGQLYWFNKLPDNLLKVQNCYQIEWDSICDLLWR